MGGRGSSRWLICSGDSSGEILPSRSRELISACLVLRLADSQLARLDAKEQKEAMKFEERWRFIDAEVHVPGGEFSHTYQPPASQSAVPFSIGPRTKFGQQLALGVSEHGMVTRKKKVRYREHGHSEAQHVVVEVPSRCGALSQSWFKTDRYKLLVARPWRYKDEHINLKEARVCLMGLRRHLRSKRNLGSRLLTLTDNLVCALSFSKGRSSSYGLNQLVRRAAAYSIFGGIKWRLRHVRSEDNVADAPSRWFDPSAEAKWKKEEARAMTRQDMSEECQDHAESLTVEELVHEDPTLAAAGLQFIELSNTGGQKVALPGSLQAGSRPMCFLEVFAGSGRLTSCMQSHGVNCLDAFEIYDGVEFDLTRPSTQAALMSIITMGLVWYIHFGLPCTVWSRARRGITNFAKARAREEISVELTLFMVAVVVEQCRLGWFFSIENPAGSRVWEFGPVASLFGVHHVQFIVWHMCEFHSPHKKPTGLLTNMGALQNLARRCSGGHIHVPLSGTEAYIGSDGKRHSRNKTAGAGEYPWSLATEWARLACSQAPDSAFTADPRDFRSVFRQHLKEVEGVRSRRKANAPVDRHQRLDIHEAHHPLRRAKEYMRRKPIVFGHHTNREVECKQLRPPTVTLKRSGHHFLAPPSGRAKHPDDCRQVGMKVRALAFVK
eukprot:Skav200633  [mRNA]  locus=scaffold353:41653:51848:+ [translate_table: standard]